MIRYVFKDGPLTFKSADKADPQVIGEALTALSIDAGGALEPDRVWRKAKEDTSSPLHKHFEWDMQKAAEHHWADTARSLIRCVRIINADTKEPERAFFSVADKGGISYRTLEAVRSSTDLQIAVLKQADRDLEAWERRYREISDACSLVRSARETIKKRRQKIETRSAHAA